MQFFYKAILVVKLFHKFLVYYQRLKVDIEYKQ